MASPEPGSRSLAAEGRVDVGAARPDGHHGREVQAPSQIPARGWWDIAVRVWQRISQDNVSLVAGGLAMYALLAVFPALAAMLSIYGLVFAPPDVLRQMQSFAGVLPPGVWDLFNSGLQDVARRNTGALTWSGLLAALVALGSARSGMSALMQATNIAYREREKRGFVRQVWISVVFTLGAVLAFLLMLTFGVALPLAVKALGSAPWIATLVSTLRWVLLWLFAVAGLAVTYRYAPAREHARWRWVTWGSALAATLWLASSVGFAFYVQRFGSYAKSYGSVANIIVLLMWFYLSAYLVVMGAEVNAEMERQTRRDTTEGPEEPLGQRGAYAADTVGPQASESKQGTASQSPAGPENPKQRR